MNEAAFPVLGTLFVFLVLLPASALLARLFLDGMDRAPRTAGVLHALNARYFLLVGSSLLPLAWLFLSLLKNGASDALRVCLFDHNAEVCSEPGVLAALLALGTVASVLTASPRTRKCEAAVSPAADEVLRRLTQLVERSPALFALNTKLVVTDEPGFALGVHGLLRHQVFVGRAFAESLSDAALSSALAHEREHVRANDPLRYWFLWLALVVNPLGRYLLLGQSRRWFAAREAQCDRNAVIHGAMPLELAEAIIVASRPFRAPTVALGANEIGVLRFRVEMLLAFAEHAPVQSRWRSSWVKVAGGVMLAALMLLSHQVGISAVGWFHVVAEQAVTHFQT